MTMEDDVKTIFIKCNNWKNGKIRNAKCCPSIRTGTDRAKKGFISMELVKFGRIELRPTVPW